MMRNCKKFILIETYRQLARIDQHIRKATCMLYGQGVQSDPIRQVHHLAIFNTLHVECNTQCHFWIVQFESTWTGYSVTALDKDARDKLGNCQFSEVIVFVFPFDSLNYSTCIDVICSSLW